MGHEPSGRAPAPSIPRQMTLTRHLAGAGGGVDGGAGGVNGAGYSDEDAPVKWSKKSGDGVGARRTRGAMAGAIGGGSAMDGVGTRRGPNYVPGGASPVAFMSPGRPSIVPASPSRRSARSLG